MLHFDSYPSERCQIPPQAVDQACSALSSLPAGVAEWTLRDAGPAGKPIWAEFLVEDFRHPLRDLAARLRAAAEEVDRLRHSAGGGARVHARRRVLNRGGGAATAPRAEPTSPLD